MTFPLIALGFGFALGYLARILRPAQKVFSWAQDQRRTHRVRFWTAQVILGLALAWAFLLRPRTTLANVRTSLEYLRAAKSARRPLTPDETERWKAVAHEVQQAFDTVLTPRPATLSREQRGAIALEHVRAGRDLLEPLLQAHIHGAHTPAGRAWRRRAVARGPYVRAFAEALTHTQALAEGAEDPPWPLLFASDLRLHLIQRHTGERRPTADVG